MHPFVVWLENTRTLYISTVGKAFDDLFIYRISCNVLRLFEAS
jgi:hypothetical protein